MSAFPSDFDTWTVDRKAAELELRKEQVRAVADAQAQAQVQIQASKDYTARYLAECQIELDRSRQSRSIEYCKCFVSPVCLSRLDSLTHLLSHSSRSPLPHLPPHQHVYFLSFALFWDSSRRGHQATLPRSCRQRRRVHHELRPGLGNRLFLHRLLQIFLREPRQSDSEQLGAPPPHRTVG